MVSYKKLVHKTMPPEKEESAKKCIVGHYILRPVSNIITIPLLETSIEPTTVTIISGFFILASMFAFVMFPSKIRFIAGWLFLLVWNILDGVDGNIARYKDKCSERGEMWESFTGWLAIIVFYTGMGMTAFFQEKSILPALESINGYYYILMGNIAGISWILPRLVMHKKSNILDRNAAENLNRKNYGAIELFVFNVTSINGLAAVVFLVAYLLKLCDLCMIGYFLLSVIAGGICLYKLLNKQSFV